MAFPRVRSEYPTSIRGYLDTPSMGLPPRSAVRRLREALAGWARGEARFEDWEHDVEGCRVEFAGLLGVHPDEVGLGASIVPAAAALAELLSRATGVVVAHRAEFRSLLLPFVSRFGDARIRWVDGPYVAQTFAAALDPDVAVVLLSSVSSADGARPDLGYLADASGPTGTIVVVDATQTLGIARLGVAPDRLGAVLAAGYKGLLGPRGVAYAYVRPDLRVTPSSAPSPYGMADTQTVGAYGPPLCPKSGAPGLDQSPAWLSWVGALPALRFIRRTTDAQREEYTTGLGQLFRAGLENQGICAQQTDLPSPVVSIEVRQPKGVVDALSAAGIRSALRRGRVRFGFHIYNTAQDVENVLTVLASPAARSGL
jgi:selenocysteine lyase/cysteine desulfurase